MGLPQRNIAAEIEERHTNKLPTPEARTAYVERVTAAMEAGARALLETAKALRANPEEMLKEAFSPNITGMHPAAMAVLELTHFDGIMTPGVPHVVVKGRTIIDGSKFNEIGFRALWKSNAITPMRDDSLG